MKGDKNTGQRAMNTEKASLGRRAVAARRRARALALQVLYEVDLTGHAWRGALEQQGGGATDDEQAAHWVEGVLAHRDELDALIRRHAPVYPVEQLAVVDRNILRLALYELRHEPETPVRVVVNEAVELAKSFGGDSSPRFVNGVLGAVVDATSVPAAPSNN